MTNYFPLEGLSWRSPAPEFVQVKTLSRVVTYSILTLVLTAPIGYFVGWGWAGTALAILIPFFAWRIFKIRDWCRTYRFSLREQDLLITQGLLSRTLVSIPYGRIQTVGIEAGILDRKWGLANVTVNTASSQDGSIPGLSKDDATALREELVNLSIDHAIAL